MAPSVPYPDVTALQRVPPAIREFPAGKELVRIYPTEGEYPTAWNRFRWEGPLEGARFDPHRPPLCRQERGVLYSAESGPTSIAEVFQDTRVIDPSFKGRRLAIFGLEVGVRLLDVSDEGWIQAAGAPRLFLRDEGRTVTQIWSRLIYEAYPDLHGISYPSARHQGGTNIALFERAIFALPAEPREDLALTDLDRTALENLAKELEYAGYTLAGEGGSQQPAS